MREVLFENNACLVVNKRAGEDSERLDDLPPDTKIIHRLDVPATGCLVLTKTKEAAAFLSAAFSNPGSVEKRYWAITEGSPDRSDTPDRAGTPGKGEWKEAVHYLGFSRAKNKSFAVTEGTRDSKRAVLRYRLLGKGERYLFFEIDLVTGRHHQIRAQLSALGFVIKGDLKYGSRRSEKQGGIRLHARSLAFPNPLAPAETVFVEAPPPKDALWNAFAAAAAP